MHIVNYFSGWCLLTSVLGMYVSGTKWVWTPPGGLGVWLVGVGSVAGLGFAGQALSTKGFQLESAGRGTLALYVQVSVEMVLDEVS